MPFKIRAACETDSAEIAALVNRAYRPAPADAGWTHESKLIKGERITAEQVASLFQAQSVVLLACLEEKIVACVHVQQSPCGAYAYIGMLATEPKLQAKGLGKQMLQHAEAFAQMHFNALTFKMSVLSSRPELLAFYERRGYKLTGKIEAYPLSANVGQPIVSGIEVLSLEKISANDSSQQGPASPPDSNHGTPPASIM